MRPTERASGVATRRIAAQSPPLRPPRSRRRGRPPRPAANRRQRGRPTRLLAGRAVQRAGWPEAREKGWNPASRGVTGTQRIPIRRPPRRATRPRTRTPTRRRSRATRTAARSSPSSRTARTSGAASSRCCCSSTGSARAWASAIASARPKIRRGAGGPGTVPRRRGRSDPAAARVQRPQHDRDPAAGESVPDQAGPEDLFGISDSLKYVGEVLKKVTSEPPGPAPRRTPPRPRRRRTGSSPPGTAAAATPAVASATRPSREVTASRGAAAALRRHQRPERAREHPRDARRLAPDRPGIRPRRRSRPPNATRHRSCLLRNTYSSCAPPQEPRRWVTIEF